MIHYHNVLDTDWNVQNSYSDVPEEWKSGAAPLLKF